MKKEAYIIAYTYFDTDSWMGSFPSYIHQWFVMEGSLPKIFDCYADAYDYSEYLIYPKIIKIAGEVKGLREPTMIDRGIQNIINNKK